jgi:hypothetical protein
MNTRKQVYKAIDTERDYQDYFFNSNQMSNKTIGDWNTVLRVYLRRAEDSWMYNGDGNVLDVIRKIAAVGVHCMEELGFVERYGYTNVGIPALREAVYRVIDGERDYQDHKWGNLDDSNSVGDFLTYMANLQRESDSKSEVDLPEASLDIIRKLTAVAVACMERHGAVRR